MAQTRFPTARWPALLALLAVGVAYAFVSASLTVGPPWLLLAILAVAAVPIAITGHRGMLHITRHIGLAASGAAAAAVTVSAALLLQQLLARGVPAGDLLLDAAILWAANVVVFALVYWELDGGGPARRQPGPEASTEFVFPQQAVGGSRAERWAPLFVDYLFLAFNTSTAFSPTDTTVLGRRAKLLMMLQSVVSLTTIAVLAARAINTLPS